MLPDNFKILEICFETMRHDPIILKYVSEALMTFAYYLKN